jgi:hypothetical protein
LSNPWVVGAALPANAGDIQEKQQTKTNQVNRLFNIILLLEEVKDTFHSAYDQMDIQDEFRSGMAVEIKPDCGELIKNS